MLACCRTGRVGWRPVVPHQHDVGVVQVDHPRHLAQHRVERDHLLLELVPVRRDARRRRRIGHELGRPIVERRVRRREGDVRELRPAHVRPPQHELRAQDGRVVARLDEARPHVEAHPVLVAARAGMAAHVGDVLGDPGDHLIEAVQPRRLFPRASDGVRAQVPLAHEERGVVAQFEALRERELVHVERLRHRRRAGVPGALAVAPEHQRAARRSARGPGNERRPAPPRAAPRDPDSACPGRALRSWFMGALPPRASRAGWRPASRTARERPSSRPDPSRVDTAPRDPRRHPRPCPTG